MKMRCWFYCIGRGGDGVKFELDTDQLLVLNASYYELG